MSDVEVTSLVDNCNGRLERVNLSYNPITDVGIRKLCEKSPKLRLLSIQHCLSLTNASVGFIKLHCPDIACVDAKGTPITEEAWDHLSCVEI